jgi:hypothetical protein
MAVTSMTPRQFEGLLEHVLGEKRIAQWRKEIVEQYRWAYGAAHSSPKRGEGGKSTGHTDPTGTVTIGQVAQAQVWHPNDEHAGAQAELRRLLASLPKQVKDIEGDLSSIEKSIERGMDRLDPRARLDEEWDGRKISPLERTDLEMAAQRRRLRGEHIA